MPWLTKIALKPEGVGQVLGMDLAREHVDDAFRTRKPYEISISDRKVRLEIKANPADSTIWLGYRNTYSERCTWQMTPFQPANGWKKNAYSIIRAMALSWLLDHEPTYSSTIP